MKPNLNGWKDCLLEHSIQPVQHFAYTTGKNATVGAMSIDAMDLLSTDRFSGFCIVSSLKAHLDKQERASDTRRKMLLGALVLHKLESGRNEEFARRLGDWLRRELPTFLTRDGDKALFTDLIGNQTTANGRVVDHAGTDIGGDGTPGAANEHAEAASYTGAG